MSRNRNNIQLNKSKLASVDSGGKSDLGKPYTMMLRSMTQGSPERYRELKKMKLIAPGYFSTWVDELILAELERLEEKAKVIKSR